MEAPEREQLPQCRHGGVVKRKLPRLDDETLRGSVVDIRALTARQAPRLSLLHHWAPVAEDCRGEDARMGRESGSEYFREAVCVAPCCAFARTCVAEAVGLAAQLNACVRRADVGKLQLQHSRTLHVKRQDLPQDVERD